jgi:hypothetical protein
MSLEPEQTAGVKPEAKSVSMFYLSEASWQKLSSLKGLIVTSIKTVETDRERAVILLACPWVPRHASGLCVKTDQISSQLIRSKLTRWWIKQPNISLFGVMLVHSIKLRLASYIFQGRIMLFSSTWERERERETCHYFLPAKDDTCYRGDSLCLA